MTICTLLQCFPKNSLAGDALRSKYLHVTSSNAPFCMHYVDDVNYCTLITLGAMGNIYMLCWNENLVMENNEIRY